MLVKKKLKITITSLLCTVLVIIMSFHKTQLLKTQNQIRQVIDPKNVGFAVRIFGLIICWLIFKRITLASHVTS
jgi:cell division protein FtsL